MIDACLQIRLYVVQELWRMQAICIRRQALSTEGPIRLFARLTGIHARNFWIQSILQLINAIDHILVIVGGDSVCLLILMNALIVFWILNLEEKLDNSDKRLWEL